MEEERAVRILLECILVLEIFDNLILCILLTASGLHVKLKVNISSTYVQSPFQGIVQ